MSTNTALQIDFVMYCLYQQNYAELHVYLLHSSAIQIQLLDSICIDGECGTRKLGDFLDILKTLSINYIKDNIFLLKVVGYTVLLFRLLVQKWDGWPMIPVYLLCPGVKLNVPCCHWVTYHLSAVSLFPKEHSLQQVSLIICDSSYSIYYTKGWSLSLEQ